jgi:hypothetical protein
VPRPTGVLGEPYKQLQSLAIADLKSEATSTQILKLALVALKFLTNECSRVDLVSLVKNKKYWAYHKKDTPNLLSRPLNAGLWESDEKKIATWWKKWRAKEQMTVIDLAKVTYTVAAAYCVAIDLFDRGNKKGPASYFEYYIGHLYAVEIGINPKTAVTFQINDKSVRLTMDLLFFPPCYTRLHVPVKISTRERVVQAWAHHRILEKVYGAGQFKGFLTVFSETKLDLQTREVIEICVPDQWLAYQTHLSVMDRIYYFDVPQRYIELAEQFPIIHLKQFGQFFVEKEEVLQPLPHA